jgi:hypothetical protein
VTERRPIAVKPSPRLRALFGGEGCRMSAFFPSEPHDDQRAGFPAGLKIMNVIRMAGCVVLVALGSSALSAGERHAGLSAYEIFSDSAPRPPRSIAHKSSGAQANPPAPAPARTQTKLPRVDAAAPAVGPVATHPAASTFPPVTPLD